MFKIILFHLGKFILSILPEGRFPRLNAYVFKMSGVRIGWNSVVYSSVSISRLVNVSIGSNSFVGSSCVFTGGAHSNIRIGNCCDISNCIHFITGSHQIDSTGLRMAGRGYAADIIVEDGCWIGYGALILPGVTIGKNSIIGAGSVVARDIPNGVVAAGNPCRVIRELH